MITRIDELQKISREEIENIDPNDINIIGRVISVKEKTVQIDDKEVPVMSILLSDGTGILRFSWWRPRTEINTGDIIKIRKGIPRYYNGRVELTSSSFTIVIVDPIDDPRYDEIPSLEELKQMFPSGGLYQRIKLEDIIDYNGKKVKVIGTVSKIYDIRVPKSEDGFKDYWIVIFGIDDETGYAKVIASSKTMGDLLDVDYDTVLQTTKDRYNDDTGLLKLLAEVKKQIGGKELIVSGSVKIDDVPSPNMIAEKIFARNVTEVSYDDIVEMLKLKKEVDENE